MSLKKRLGNVDIKYADFLAFKFFPLLRDAKTFITFYFGQIQLLKAHIYIFKGTYLCS